MKTLVLISFFILSISLFSQDSKENIYMDENFEFTKVDTVFFLENIEKIRYINQSNNAEFFIKFHNNNSGIVETGHLKNGIYYGDWNEYNNEGKVIKSLDFDTLLIQGSDILKIAEKNKFDLEIYKIDYIFEELWSEEPKENHWTITKTEDFKPASATEISGITVCAISGKQSPYNLTIMHQPVWPNYDTPPMFDENMGSVEEFIKINSRYPISENQNSKNAVNVLFKVTDKGVLTNIKTFKANTGDFKREAKRLVEIMPDWIPAKKNGEAVECKHHKISINFE
ncbi:MAG: hypothetical protein C0595_00840 [Marinilabiliales bacterium]|nr:MAG: hypothetical protein C0595_00840 [Marinilabiliales bacterium]